MKFSDQNLFYAWLERALSNRLPKYYNNSFIPPRDYEEKATVVLKEICPSIEMPSIYGDGGWKGLHNYMEKIWAKNIHILYLPKSTVSYEKKDFIQAQNNIWINHKEVDHDLELQSKWNDYNDTISMNTKVQIKKEERISAQSGKYDDNVFTILENTVKCIYEQYVSLRKRIDWKDSGSYRTITRLARPFMDGYFTIAVAGKMSAGKSTFINTLIGEELLPVGHFQTTSTITWIVSSDKREMHVKYANGERKVFSDNLADELMKISAVPEKYEKLPINRINIEIIKGTSLENILNKKAEIEKETESNASESLWRTYIQDTRPSDIAVKIEIFLPLPKQYRGWRIVDTPGVGAIGGIQETTIDLLTSRDAESDNHEVDAVILLHKGSENIQDETANKFAKGVKDGLGSLADGRLFFVLTHAMSSEFKKEKEKIIDKAKDQFGNRLGIPHDRILYVDSLVERLINDSKREKIDFSSTDGKLPRTPWKGWNKVEWKEMRHLLDDICDLLDEENREISNSTVFSKLNDEARFSILKEKLDSFLLDNKAQTYKDLFERIEKELTAFESKLRIDIETVSNGKDSINKKIEENTNEASRLQNVLGKIREKATPMVVKSKFSFITDELLKLKNKENLPSIKTAYKEIIERGIKTEKEFFESLISEFRSYCSEFKNESIIFQSIDLDDLEKEATKMATEQVIDKGRPETISHCCSADEVYYPHKKSQVNREKQIREFLARIVKKGKEIADKYVNGVENKLNNFFNIVYKEINRKESARKSELDGYYSDIDNKDKIIIRLKNNLSEVNCSLDELKKYKQ